MVKMTTADSLPLRGLLICPHCGKQLTGSASKGRHSYYYYYHCISSCGVRFKAEVANEGIVNELNKFVPKKEIAELYKTVIKDIFYQQTGSQTDGRKELLNQIQAETDRLAKARRLLLDDAIDSSDYKLIKSECETKLLSLEAKLTGFSEKTYDLRDCIDKAITNLTSLQIAYSEGDTTAKRSVIDSIYPEKLCFDGMTYRTAKINEAAQLIYLINSQLGSKKIGQNLIFQACPIRQPQSD